MRRLLMLVTVIVLVAVPTAALAQETAIRTFARTGERTTAFDAGEDFVVLGTNFPGDASVVLTFEQDTTSDLGTFSVTTEGTFRADVAIPSDAQSSAATVRAVSGETEATTGIQVTGTDDGEAPPISDPDDAGDEEAVDGGGGGFGDEERDGTDGGSQDGEDGSAVEAAGGSADADNALDPWLWLAVGGGVAFAAVIALLFRRRGA